ncbi:nuclear transport factor 2 family protein [Rhodococcus sp. CH91]|uniref:nuclear transport factor 2 family protein n=1 Tax=Rhodococcus sp. CH91 TaxID=2910256 RepID=UPI001F4A10C8|nr:nuclear transport factor 2 family protein [Rhodococcus sp. CH91]
MNHPSDLAGRYAVAVDERDAVALAAVFTTDAEFVRPPGLTRDAGASVTTGADAIAAAILGSVSHLHGTRHAVHQQVIDIDGDTAGGTVYCLAHHLYRGRDGMRDDAIAVRYRDEYRRTGNRWQIARRELLIDFIENRAVRVPGVPAGPRDPGDRPR